MSNLSLNIMELLGASLGLEKGYLREFFEGQDSIMRLNYYPPCKKPDQTLGTGPHCDPVSLTILYQADVSGLEVCVDGKWHSIPPKSDAFVVNIGDTFMVRTCENKFYMHSIIFHFVLRLKMLNLFTCLNPLVLSCLIFVHIHKIYCLSELPISRYLLISKLRPFVEKMISRLFVRIKK